MTKKLLIWDFDGVIADSEKLWVKVWRDNLQKYFNLTLDNEQARELLVGVADKTRKERVENKFELKLDNDFMAAIADDEIYQGTHFMEPIEGVLEIMQDELFDNCIATGATIEQHAWKMTRFSEIDNIIPRQYQFCVDMVERGKPAPDLFLLAAKTKGYGKKDCMVIGDSLNDFAAAKSAGIECMAFVGATGNNTPEYKHKCIEAGVYGVAATMNELHQKLSAWAK